MANVEFIGKVRLQDAHQLRSTKTVRIFIDDTIHVTPTAQRDQALAMMTAFVEEMDDIIDPVVVETTLTMPVVPAGLKSSPGDQGVAEGANLLLATTDGLGNAVNRPYWLPGAAASIFLANFRTINTAVQALIEWVASFNDAGGEIVISDGEVVTGITSGQYATRQRNTTA